MGFKLTVVFLCLLLCVAAAEETFAIFEAEDVELDGLMLNWANAKTQAESQQTTTDHRERNKTDSVAISWYVHVDAKLKALNSQYQPCDAECSELIDAIKHWLPPGPWCLALDWLKYFLANPILVSARLATIIVLFVLFKVIWPRILACIRFCKNRYGGGGARSGRKPNKMVRFADPVVTEKILYEHSLVRIFETPETSQKSGYIGVYMYTCHETGMISIRQVPFTNPDHIALAQSRLQYQNTKIVCRSMQRPGTFGLTLLPVQKYQPAKLWQKQGTQHGQIITIDKMLLEKRECIYMRSNSGREVPVIDVYGVVHQSMHAYLCNSAPLTMTDVRTTSLTRSSMVTETVACSETSCAVKPLPKNVKTLDWEGSDLEQIQERTERLKVVLQQREVEFGKIRARHATMQVSEPSDVNWKNLVDTCSQYVGLISQIDPAAQSSVFCWAKRFFGFLAFASRLGSATAIKNAPSFDLTKLSRNTHIKYGTPLDYAELCRVAKPGDMIAVHGVHAMSRIICTIQSKLKDGEEYLSHVMMIVDTSVFIMPGMVPGELYVIESCTGGGMIDDSYDVLPDVFQISKSGVQVRSLRGLLSESAKQNSLYLWCPLNEKNRAIFDANVGVNRSNIHKPCKIVSNLQKYLNKRYTLTPSNFFLGSSNSNIDGSYVGDAARDVLTSHALRNQSAIGSEYFCSELVGDIYKDTGLLEPKEVIPYGAHLHETLTVQDLAEHFYVGRQLFPLDFFLVHSKIPYLFGDICVIHPTQTIV